MSGDRNEHTDGIGESPAHDPGNPSAHDPGDDQSVAEKGVDPGNVYVSDTHAAVLADIVGHPYQLPTLPELVYTNRKRDKPLVKRSLRELVQEGLVEEVRFEDGSPHPRHPDLFFGITDYGRSVLFNRIPEETEPKLQAAYAQARKPEDIKRFERAPRPPRPSRGPDESRGSDHGDAGRGGREDTGAPPAFGGSSEDLLEDLSDDVNERD